MKFKKIAALFLLALVITVLPITAFATNNDTPFTITLECKINNVVPVNTDFVFEVTSADIKDEANITNETKLNDFTVSTKTNTDGKAVYSFGAETPENKYFSLKLKSCNNKLAIIDNKKVEVRFFSETIKVSVWEDDIEIENFIYPDDEVPAFNVNLALMPEVKISTEGCEAITKVYDGTLTALVTDKNYKLTGFSETHDVKLAFDKAQYDNADVKKATKVILSGLKLTGNDANKYALSSDTIALNAAITPRPITVTADNLVMTMGSPEPTLTYKLSEQLVSGNTVTGELERASGITAGEYAITQGTLSLGDNYTITFVEGKLNVSNFGFYQVLDRNTSVKIAGYFSPDESVTALPLDPNSTVYSTLAASSGWGNIISSFDVIFTSTDYDGNLTVYLPVDPKFEGKEITVYQQASHGGITCFKVIAKGGYAAVETNECTQFMLVTEKPAEKENSGSIAWKILKTIIIILVVIFSLALAIALFFFGMIFFNKTNELKKLIKAIRKILKK